MVGMAPNRDKYLLTRWASTARTSTPFLPRRKIGCISGYKCALLHVTLNPLLTCFSAVLGLGHVGHSWAFHALIRK